MFVPERHEPIGDIVIPNLNQPYTLPTGSGTLPTDRPMYGLRLDCQFRLTNPASGYPTAIEPDAPYSFLENITIQGQHIIRGQNEQFYNLRGAEARQLNKIYSGRSPLAPASISVATNGVTDVRFIIHIEFPPEQIPMRQKAYWLLDANNYRQLKLSVQVSDTLSLCTGQTTQPGITTYGLTTGYAKIRVSGLFAQMGGAAVPNFVPGRVFRTYQEVSTGDIVSGANGSRLYYPPRGNGWLRSILMKTGAKSSTATAGNNVYHTLSDTILTNLRIMQGTNKMIRGWNDVSELKEDTANFYGITPDTGYSLIDFAQCNDLRNSLNTQRLVNGPSGDVDLYLQADVAAGASQAALFACQELRYPPSIIVRDKNGKAQSVSVMGN